MPESCTEGGSAPLTILEARGIVLERVSPVNGWERVPLQSALNRVVLQDVVAPFNVPPWDNSAMDGFAVRRADCLEPEPLLQIVGAAEPGRVFTGLVGEGQAVRVVTGAAIPRGADAVVPLECARTTGSTVCIQGGIEPGQHIRHSGEDLAEGSRAIPSGRRLGPAELGILASLGLAEVLVRRRLRVALLSAGSEAATFGRPLGFGESFDANRYILFGLLAEMGVDLMDLGALHGDPESMEAAIRAAAEGVDVVLAYSRNSSLDKDWLKPLLLGSARMEFWHVNIRPGRPLGFGRLGPSWFFTLPLNPVAVMVTYYEIIADALRKLAGEHPLATRTEFRVRSLSSIRKMSGCCEYLRGNLIQEGEETCVRLLPGQGSGVLSSMADSDCFIVLPEEAGDLREGDFVRVRPFRGLS
ncbi:gephyrin-like molybdotransferase Glp [Holophaga foetida]|uniref:molybdopterin molybdotransferase MoeA n=1 Tax=Holophaga foetida TaxID=35839 RepID=UPI00024750A9|nr:gephyrin-like molybdotransferase Glp [Holophaga foetida]